MAGNYWIKLFLEILDDSKMAILPDRLWRRIIELFLFAGEYHKDGALPDTAQIAWRLRMPLDELDLDLRQLEPTKIIRKTDTGWLIPKFAERQKKMTPSEKMQLYRDKQRKAQYYQEDDVTLSNSTVTQINRLTDNRLTDTESDISFSSDLLNLYSTNLGEVPAIMIPTLKQAEKEYPADWFSKAFEVMNGHGKGYRNWAYVEGILKNWKASGNPTGKTSKKQAQRRDSEEAIKRYGEWET